MDAIAGHGFGLRAEEVLEVNRAEDRFVNFGMIIDEVRQPEFFAVDPLFRAGEAEAHVGPRQAGALVEVVRLKPAQRAVLDSRPALRHQPDAAVEQAGQAGDRRHAAVHLGGGEHRGLVALEERGIAPGGVRRAVDDDLADVDPETRRPAHTISMFRRSVNRFVWSRAWSQSRDSRVARVASSQTVSWSVCGGRSTRSAARLLIMPDMAGPWSRT